MRRMAGWAPLRGAALLKAVSPWAGCRPILGRFRRWAATGCRHPTTCGWTCQGARWPLYSGIKGRVSLGWEVGGKAQLAWAGRLGDHGEMRRWAKTCEERHRKLEASGRNYSRGGCRSRTKRRHGTTTGEGPSQGRLEADLHFGHSIRVRPQPPFRVGPLRARRAGDRPPCAPGPGAGRPCPAA
jgi:hypothetical protein